MTRSRWFSADSRFVRWAATAGVALLGIASSLTASEIDRAAAYFQQMRARGLFAVAERLGESRIRVPGQSEGEAAALAVELSKTYSQHAAALDNAVDRAALWERAELAISELRNSKSEAVRQEGELQSAMIAADRERSARWQSELNPDDEALRDEATALALTGVSQLQKWIDAEDRFRAANAGGGLAGLSHRRSGMRRDAQVRLSAVWLELAELQSEPNQKAKAIAEASKALDLLKNVTSMEWEIAPLRLKLARLQEDDKKLASFARSRLSDAPSPAVRQSCIAELVRRKIDAGDPRGAADLLVQEAKGGGEVSDELRALHVVSVLGLWKIAGAGERDAIWKGAEAEVSRIHGAWGYWAQSKLDRVQDDVRYGELAAKELRRGQAAYRAGQRDVAADFYGDAAAAAANDGRKEQAGQLAFIQASILVEDGKPSAAAVVLEPLVSGGDSSEESAQASLLLAYCRGQEALKHPSDDNDARYEASLRDHLQKFVNHATADEARWMLGSQAIRKGRLKEGLESLAQISPQHARYWVANDLAAETYLRTLIQLSNPESSTVEGRSRSDWEGAAEQWLRAVMARIASAPTKLELEPARFLMQAARLSLMQSPPRYAELAKLLQRVVTTGEQQIRERAVQGQPAPDDWAALITQARALQIIAAAGGGDMLESRRLLELLPADQPAHLVDVLDGLRRYSGAIPASQRQELGRLELATIEKLRPRFDQLTAVELRQLKQAEAGALVAAGQTTEAVAAYEALVAESPRDVGLIRSLAESLQLERSPEALAKARQRWKQIEQLSPPGSGDWLSARADTAACFLLEGKPADAKKLVAVTRIVYPELGGAELKGRFEAIEREAVAALKKIR